MVETPKFVPPPTLWDRISEASDQVRCKIGRAWIEAGVQNNKETLSEALAALDRLEQLLEEKWSEEENAAYEWMERE